MGSDYLFTSESVSEGHPDKMADQISDAIVDALILEAAHARVACETMINASMVVISGEISGCAARMDFASIARGIIEGVGYTRTQGGYDANDLAVLLALNEQSPDIAMGVDETDGHEQGAGDQGLMFGFACDETESLMPVPISLAHGLVRRQASLRKSGRLAWLRPDAKSQVSVRYVNHEPVGIDSIVFSTQHDPDITLGDLREAVMEEIIRPVLPGKWVDGSTRYYINPTGRFVIGGPTGDCGLTGRKIIVDTYGGMARHGGGAFSGKDPSKVDRSAAYAARYVAKNIVASGLARRCEVQISYAIGIAEPTSISLNTFGTGRLDEARLVEIIKAHFDLRPRSIIRTLDLLQPIYQDTAAYGHFGRSDIAFPWERTDKAAILRSATG